MTRTFDLSHVGAPGVQAILDGLRVDGENVRRHDLDAETGTLTVEFARRGAAEHVEAFVAQMTRMHRRIARKVLVEQHAADLTLLDVDAALLSHPDVYVLGDGLIGLRGALRDLFRFFERTFRGFAGDYLAEEQHYPVMVPAELLAEIGYFGHFPQQVTFCSHLRGDLPALEAFGQTAADRVPEHVPLAPPGHVLSPAVCLPCYRQQQGAVVHGTRVLTMQNHVFRYEGSSFRPLRRAWDFTVRDIVFFSDYAELVRLRQEVMDRTIRLCRELDLEVTIEVASDPFFLDANRDKAIYQRMGEVKYELLFPVANRSPIAASSFNLHRDYYTSVYNTHRADGSLVESACIGFGLERWVYGFIAQKGLDRSRWPI